MFNIVVEKVTHKKSNDVIKKYVETLKKELFDEEEHPWMREDPFDGDNYQCNFNGKKVSLSNIFWKEESLRKENIIIICGKKHIGKSFFAEKILKACEQSVDNKKDNLVWRKNIGMYRIPIIIERDWFVNWKEKNIYDLETLILDVILEKYDDYLNEDLKEIVKKDIYQLLTYGKFVVYFQDNDWLKIQDGVEKILNYGKIFENYNERTKFHNIILLTSDVDAQVKESFLKKEHCGYITLEKLSEQEVEHYLVKRLSDFMEIAKKNDHIMKLLCYPEHLKMFEALCDRKMIKNEVKISDEYELYDFFIRTHISEKLREKGEYRKERVNSIFSWLRNYAWEIWICKNEQKIITGEINRFFHFNDFISCGLLDDDGKFTFPYCRDYLVADKLLESLKSNKEKLSQEFYKIEQAEDLEIVLSLVSGLIKDRKIFSAYWSMLENNSKIPLLLLVKILKKSLFGPVFQEFLYEKAFNNLKSEFYDYSVLETFEELKPECAEYLKIKYLKLNKYSEKERNNIKKRIVYYLGISKNGLIEDMIDELLDDKTEKHLKYHIIRAAVENYNENDETTKLVNKNIDRMGIYCHRQDDPIIKSDFEVLFKKCKGKAWRDEAGKLDILEQVESKLEDDIYWIRAHAAGAIGRRNRENASTLLLDRVRKELQNIYNLNADFRNSIKVISYSVEALCERHERILSDEKNNIIMSLADMIDISKMHNLEMEDAYSTIATGIEYMINSNKDKLAFNLGGRFRNRTSNYKRVLLYILEELINYYESEKEIVTTFKQKCRELEGVKLTKSEEKIKRIMHLSDWHLIEDSSYNNEIFMQLESFKPIDLLIITGDLKQFGENYGNALKNLNHLVKGLEIKVKDVFMVPGNHDANTIDNQDNIYKEIRDKIWDNIDSYKKYKTELESAFDEYGQFLKDFFGEEWLEHGGIHNRVIMWDNVLQIVCINTSLVCDADSNQKKIVDTYELSQLSCDRSVPTIAISHHPYAEINENQGKLVEGVLKRLNTSMLLSGDKHISRNDTIGGKYGIPNLIIGKNFCDNGDHYSDVNVCIYEVNFETMKIRPYLKRWNGGGFVPSFEFSYDRNNDGNYETQIIDLLCEVKS